MFQAKSQIINMHMVIVGKWFDKNVLRYLPQNLNKYDFFITIVYRILKYML